MSEYQIPAEVLAQAAQKLAAEAMPKEHGQLCPVAQQKAYKIEIIKCDCWILADARADIKVAAPLVAAAAYRAGREQAARDIAERIGQCYTNVDTDEYNGGIAAGAQIARDYSAEVNGG